jgi:hypothetical protein
MLWMKKRQKDRAIDSKQTNFCPDWCYIISPTCHFAKNFSFYPINFQVTRMLQFLTLNFLSFLNFKMKIARMLQVKKRQKDKVIDSK